MASLKTKQPKTLPSVRPNAGIEAAYRRRLMAMIDAMQADIKRQVERAYRDNEPEMAGDASPAMTLRDLMDKLTRKWTKRFDDASLELAQYFVGKVKDTSRASFQAALKKAGFSVEFKMTRAMNDVIQASVGENVSLIKSIPQQHLTDVEGMVMRSVQAGRDLHTLSQDLTKRYNITRRRAATISRDQNNKATAQLNRARQTELGITEAIWKHSRGGHSPRASHVAFDGHKFNLKDGHDFGDGFGPVLPGEAINCKCTWMPVIPGLS